MHMMQITWRIWLKQLEIFTLSSWAEMHRIRLYYNKTFGTNILVLPAVVNLTCKW